MGVFCDMEARNWREVTKCMSYSQHIGTVLVITELALLLIAGLLKKVFTTQYQSLEPPTPILAWLNKSLGAEGYGFLCLWPQDTTAVSVLLKSSQLSFASFVL